MKNNLKKNFWKSLIETGHKLEVKAADLSTVNNETLKILRNDLNLSQAKFANIIGVSKKTVEKWEQGANPIQGPTARLIYLIMNDHSIIKRIYSSEITLENTEKSCSTYTFVPTKEHADNHYTQSEILHYQINESFRDDSQGGYLWTTTNLSLIS